VEASLKVARLATGKPAVLSFLGGFHGKTGGSLAVTANPRLRSGVSAVAPDVFRLPYPDAAGTRGAGETLAWIEEILTHPDFDLEGIAGIIVEPIQGSTGMTAPPSGFLAGLRELTARLGLLLIVDDIFTGFGRSGRMFGFDEEGVVPDIAVLGKALGGGLPISVIAGPATVMRHIPAYKQTSTFSGHPLGCAAGLAVLDVIEQEGLSANAAARGEQLRSNLERLSGDGVRVTVTGRGLMLGVRLDTGSRDASRELATELARQLPTVGVLCLRGGTWGNVIKITAPLILTAEEVEMACERFARALGAARERLRPVVEEQATVLS
jgi:4-aminobutyrate aminotransferase-like enzyme